LRQIILALGFTVATVMAAPLALASDPPLELSWQKLVPEEAIRDALRAKSFTIGSKPFGSTSEPPAPTPLDPEAPWMSQRRLQPGTGGVPKVVADLNGKRVRIGGYVVPLDFDATTVKEFLLVPFVGACIHVPPPPPNQIIYVKSEKGIEVTGSFDPVYVTGKMETAQQFTGLAEAGYTIEAETVELKK
jgi:uncharacterized protein